MGRKPHVLLIIADEWRADATGFAGDPLVKTPHLDALAKDSLVCKKAYCASPMCVPSRVSLATARHPQAHGALDNVMKPKPSERSLYETIRSSGYQTFNAGKWHTNVNAHQWGFDIHHSEVPEPAKHITCFGTTDPELRKKACTVRNPGLLSLVMHGLNPIAESQTADTIFTKHLLDHMESMDLGQPQFMRLSLLDPHSPYQPIDQYHGLLKPEAIDLPNSYEVDYDHKPKLQAFFHKARGFEHLSAEDYKLAKSCYLGLIQHNDDRIARVMAKLKQIGIYDETLIVFCSDHGAMMGEQGCLEKWGHMYEPVAKIPLLFKFPNGEHAGTCLDDFVENVDILPTVLDVIGSPLPTGIHGMSLMPRVRGAVARHRDHAICSYMSCGLMDEPATMLRFGPWKVTFYPSPSRLEQSLPVDHFLRNGPLFDHDHPRGELYNLDLDPGEVNNLFGLGAYDPILQEAKAILEQRFSAMGEVTLPEIPRAERPWSDFRVLLEGDYHHRIGECFHL